MQVRVCDGVLIAVIAGACLAVAAWSPVRVRLRLTVRGLRATLAVDVSVLWGLYRLSIAPGRGAPDRASRRRAPERGAEHLSALLHMLKNATCERLAFRLALGTGDAGSTGVLAGIAWAIAGLAVSVARARVGRWRCVPAVSVTPSFHREVLESDLDCILAVRAAHAALAVGRVALAEARRRGPGRARAPA